MIVMDLEWNHGTVDKQLLLEGRTLRFEIIQIGAVQVDSLGNICKTFERLCASHHYAKGHRADRHHRQKSKGSAGICAGMAGLLPLGRRRKKNCFLGKLRQGSFAVQSAVP